MLLLLPLLMPFVVCCIFCTLLYGHKNKTLSQRYLLVTASSTGLYFLCDALVLFPYSDPLLIVFCYIAMAFVVPALPLCYSMFAWSLFSGAQRYNKKLLLLFLIPSSFGFIDFVGFALVGFDNAADFILHHNMLPPDIDDTERIFYSICTFVSGQLYNIVVAVSMLISIVFTFVLLLRSDFTPSVFLRFLFMRGPIRLLHLEVLLYYLFIIFSAIRLFYSRVDLLNDPTAIVVLFIGMAVFAGINIYLGVHLKRPAAYLSKPHRRPKFDDMPVDFVFRRRQLDDNEDDESDSYRTLNLRDEFKEVMRERQSYLEPGFCRYSISSTLNITRRALDRLIRIVYHITFEEYIMIQRVEHYSRYRALYPDEPLTTVAMECGFSSVREMHKQVRECRILFDVKA
ncbi:MAG: helix-turn-helix domain-containing protein [Bacteroidales bacterium]|nr:helix-turn-helix domain-containing protein [Candidatus Liminaster caballi]